MCTNSTKIGNVIYITNKKRRGYDEMRKPLKFAVLGGGHGGLALTGRLSAAGYEVNLYEHPRFENNIKPVKELGGIEIAGPAAPKTGFAKIKGIITTNIQEAIKGVHAIMVVVPAFAHRTFYELMIPHLEDGQLVLTHTGNWGSLELVNMLSEKKIERDIKIAETSILIYACRVSAPAKISIFRHKNNLLTAAIPSKDNEYIITTLNEAFPELVPARNVLVTSLSNLNYQHVPITILNAGRIESTKGDFLFWKDGASPAVANVIKSMDEERMLVMKALGLEPTSMLDISNKMYNTSKDSYYKMIQTLPELHVTRAPSTLEHRYLFEDVPFGLVPVASLGDLLEVPTPITHGLVHVASTLVNTDFMHEGANVNRLGLAGLTPKEIMDKVNS
jgi:opine dehydrogenase